MSAISPTTRSRIKAYLEVFVENLVNEYRDRSIPKPDTPSVYLANKSSKGQLKPFHSVVVPTEVLRISAFERGLSMGLGTTYEECAKLIALDHHVEAHRGYDVVGDVSVEALDEIERQRVVFEHAADRKGNKPSFDEMISAVLIARESGMRLRRSSKADLFVRAHDGTKLFFEMKAPTPNKDQCLRIIEQLLRVHLLVGEPRSTTRTYLSMAYNPYGSSRDDYRWSFARNYFPFDQGVVIGHEFWTLIGGPNVYEELLSVYAEVGREKGKFIVDALAFGF